MAPKKNSFQRSLPYSATMEETLESSCWKTLAPCSSNRQISNLCYQQVVDIDTTSWSVVRQIQRCLSHYYSARYALVHQVSSETLPSPKKTDYLANTFWPKMVPPETT